MARTVFIDALVDPIDGVYQRIRISCGVRATRGPVTLSRLVRWPARANRPSRRLSSHLVTKLDHAALVGFDLREMEGDVSVELLEEWDPITNQDRQDRITNFVG